MRILTGILVLVVWPVLALGQSKPPPWEVGGGIDTQQPEPCNEADPYMEPLQGEMPDSTWAIAKRWFQGRLNGIDDGDKRCKVADALVAWVEATFRAPSKASSKGGVKTHAGDAGPQGTEVKFRVANGPAQGSTVTATVRQAPEGDGVSAREVRRSTGDGSSVPPSVRINIEGKAPDDTTGQIATTVEGDSLAPQQEVLGREAQTPEELMLRGNAPNPFYEATTIRYALPEPASVRVEIYDVLGRQVAVLDEGKQSSGHHTFEWAPRRLSGGKYFYRFVVDSGDSITVREGEMTLIP